MSTLPRLLSRATSKRIDHPPNKIREKEDPTYLINNVVVVADDPAVLAM